MADEVDMTVSTKHYNRFVKDGRTAEAAALMSIHAGALWSPARLQEAGLPAENGVHKCPLCGKEGMDQATFLGNPRKFAKTVILESKKQTDIVMNIAAMGLP